MLKPGNHLRLAPRDSYAPAVAIALQLPKAKLLEALGPCLGKAGDRDVLDVLLVHGEHHLHCVLFRFPGHRQRSKHMRLTREGRRHILPVTALGCVALLPPLVQVGPATVLGHLVLAVGLLRANHVAKLILEAVVAQTEEKGRLAHNIGFSSFAPSASPFWSASTALSETSAGGTFLGTGSVPSPVPKPVANGAPRPLLLLVDLGAALVSRLSRLLRAKKAAALLQVPQLPPALLVRGVGSEDGFVTGGACIRDLLRLLVGVLLVGLRGQGIVVLRLVLADGLVLIVVVVLLVGGVGVATLAPKTTASAFAALLPRAVVPSGSLLLLVGVEVGDPKRLLDALEGVVTLVGKKDLSAVFSGKAGVAEEEVSQQVLGHGHSVGQVHQVRPALAPHPQEAVHRLAAPPVAPVEEGVKGLGLLDNPDLLNGLEGREDMLVPVLCPQLGAVVEEVLACPPSLAVQRVNQALGEASLLLLEAAGFLGLVVTGALQIVKGKEDPPSVLFHELRLLPCEMGDAIAVHHDLIITPENLGIGHCSARTSSATSAEHALAALGSLLVASMQRSVFRETALAVKRCMP